MSTEFIPPLLAYALSGIIVVLSVVALICLPYAKPKSPLLTGALLLISGVANSFSFMLHAIDTSNDSSMLISMLALVGVAALLCTPQFWSYIKNIYFPIVVNFFRFYGMLNSNPSTAGIRALWDLFRLGLGSCILTVVTIGAVILSGILGTIVTPLLWLYYVLIIYIRAIKRIVNSVKAETGAMSVDSDQKSEEVEETSTPLYMSIGFGAVLFLGLISVTGSLLHIPAMTLGTLVSRPLLKAAYDFEADCSKSAQKGIDDVSTNMNKPKSAQVPVLTLSNGSYSKTYQTRTVFGREAYLNEICKQSSESSNLQFYIFPSTEEVTEKSTWMLASCNTNNSDMETYINGQELTTKAVTLSSGDIITLCEDGKVLCTITAQIPS